MVNCVDSQSNGNASPVAPKPLRNRNRWQVTCSPRPPTLSQRHVDLHVWLYPRRSYYSKFHRNPLRGFGAPWGRNLAIPITFDMGFYNSLYYRTSRDQRLVFSVICLSSVALSMSSSNASYSSTCIYWKHKKMKKTKSDGKRQCNSDLRHACKERRWGERNM